MKVDLGAGDFPEPGFETLDAHAPADHQARLQSLPFDDDSCDELRLSHSLEHVSRADVPKVLTECWRVLRSGGRMYVEVPDLDGIAREWIAAPQDTKPRMLDFFYGNQAREGEFHLTGFNAYILAGAVREAGFTIESVDPLVSHAAPAVAVRAVKP